MRACDLTDSDDNRRALDSAVAVVCGGRTLLFAGAGVAVPADYPSWNGLLRDLEKLCDSVGSGFVHDPTARESTPLAYAEMIKNHVRRCTGDLAQYSDYIVGLFSQPPSLQTFHYDLVALPFRGFVTTNYDSTLEWALAQREHQPADKTVIIGDCPGRLVWEYNSSLTRSDNQRRVAHIHGHFRNPTSIVLSESDYVEAYGLDAPPPVPPDYTLPRVVEFLKTLLASWALVFVGFSFRDPHFAVFLEAASKRYGLWHSATHYAFIATTDDDADQHFQNAARYKAEYGIQTIFYERLGESHEKLYELIGDVRKGCGVTSSGGTPDINVRTIEDLRA